MTMMSFESDEEMAAFAADNSKRVMEGLAEAQRSLKFGDYWVRFVNPSSDPPDVEFGHILTPTEIARNMFEDGVEWDDVKDFIESTTSKLDDHGLMWGTASTYRFPLHELGQTHKASVWPIEKRLFDWAVEARFNVNEMGTDAQMLLKVAYAQMRAHVLPKGTS
jgi:hypothetical protein